jgi:hypothetical protein
VAGGTRGGQVDWAQPVTFGQQQLGRGDVLADRAHVLPRSRGRLDLGHAVLPVHLFAHDHRVAALRERVTGVDDGELLDAARGGLGRAKGVGSAHRDAVHRRCVVGGRGAKRPDRRSGHAPECAGQPKLDGLQPVGNGGQPGRNRLVGRDVGQKGGAAGHAQQ